MAWAPIAFGVLLAQLLALHVVGASDLPDCAVDADACLGAGDIAEEAWSEGQIEDQEEAESALMEVQLLQTKIQTRPMPVGAASAPAHHVAQSAAAADLSKVALHASSAEQASAATKDVAGANASAAAGEGSSASSDSIVSLDHNGHICMLCGKPLPERMGTRKYTEFRTDCGRRSSPTGPSAADLTVPAVEFARSGKSADLSMNGFCALNFAKSCADAVANRDYLYWPKSLDLASAAMSANAPWDARYCGLNGFLHKDIVKLQNNFTGMREKAQELCDTKYAKHGIEKLTFLDMMSKSRYDDKEAPTQQEAELLAAWNCAMGDLGCDMAMCAYSFCHQDKGAFGLYNECAGWDPVEGMPL
mmetsp:Transcript_97072/g.257931  ORF Transcript_97072/g.257931 Transcript_97072/m.257931 type:complete len:361 (-) Transcript_97072:21-1103(-)